MGASPKGLPTSGSSLPRPLHSRRGEARAPLSWPHPRAHAALQRPPSAPPAHLSLQVTDSG